MSYRKRTEESAHESTSKVLAREASVFCDFQCNSVRFLRALSALTLIPLDTVSNFSQSRSALGSTRRVFPAWSYKLAAGS